jgi:hypothetical protein
MNPAHCINCQRDDVLDVAAHEPFESVTDAHDVEALEAGPNRGRAADAVDSWSGTATDQNCESPMEFHTQSGRSVPSMAEDGEVSFLISDSTTSLRGTPHDIVSFQIFCVDDLFADFLKI